MSDDPATENDKWEPLRKRARLVGIGEKEIDDYRQMDNFELFRTTVELTEKLQGTCFSNSKLFWDDQVVHRPEINESWYKKIVRKPEQGQLLYAAVVSSENLKCTLAPDKNSRNSTANSVSSSAKSKKQDAFGNKTIQAAHLVPHSFLCSKAYGFVAEAATGRVDSTKLERLKLVNGVLVDDERLPDTGIKHHEYNKLWLHSPKYYFDCPEPPLVILPLLSLDEVLNWNGKRSYRIVSITTGESTSDDTTGCQQKVLQNAEISQNPRQDLDIARQLLEVFLKALAASDIHHEVNESITNDDWKEYSPVQAWLQLLSEMKDGNQGLKLPREKSDVDWATVRVAVGSLSLETSLPDPFLLCIKVAINYSAYTGAALLPRCPSLSTSDEWSSSDGEVNVADDSSNLAEREYNSIVASLQNPNRLVKELFSEDENYPIPDDI